VYHFANLGRTRARFDFARTGLSFIVGMLDLDTKEIQEEVGGIQEEQGEDFGWRELQVLDRVFSAVLELASSISALVCLRV
jgi:hypothetical protein